MLSEFFLLCKAILDLFHKKYVRVFNKKTCDSCVFIMFSPPTAPRSFDDVYSTRISALSSFLPNFLPTFTFHYFIRGMSRQSLDSSFQDLTNVLS